MSIGLRPPKHDFFMTFRHDFLPNERCKQVFQTIISRSKLLLLNMASYIIMKLNQFEQIVRELVGLMRSPAFVYYCFSVDFN